MEAHGPELHARSMSVPRPSSRSAARAWEGAQVGFRRHAPVWPGMARGAVSARGSTRTRGPRPLHGRDTWRALGGPRGAALKAAGAHAHQGTSRL